MTTTKRLCVPEEARSRLGIEVPDDLMDYDEARIRRIGALLAGTTSWKETE